MYFLNKIYQQNVEKSDKWKREREREWEWKRKVMKIHNFCSAMFTKSIFRILQFALISEVHVGIWPEWLPIQKFSQKQLN